MKFSIIALAGLASTVAAQYQGGQGQQQQQPIQGYQPSQGYQQPAQYQGYQPAQQASQGRWPRLSTQEISDWQGCTNLLLNAFNDNVPGSGPACEMWKCLHVQANKYGRGGALTTLSNALNPVCGLNNVFNVFHW